MVKRGVAAPSKTLFYITTVKNLKGFKYQVSKLARQKDANLFHCYCQGVIFRIATAKKVMDFDFTEF
jgi:hypothetical protein